MTHDVVCVTLDDNYLPHYGEVHEDASNKPYHENRHGGSQDLSSVPTKGHLLGLGLGGHPDGEQGDEEGGDVGEEVGGVGGDGQGVAQHPANDLRDHEEDAEDSRSHELTSRSDLRETFDFLDKA